jgi:hypothetical protein
MSDADSLWFTSGHRPTPTAVPERAGIEVWRLYDSQRRAIRCVLHDDSKMGAGWDVRVMAEAEPLYSQRCADRVGADVVARTLREETVRAGCTALPCGPESAAAPRR